MSANTDAEGVDADGAVLGATVPPQADTRSAIASSLFIRGAYSAAQPVRITLTLTPMSRRGDPTRIDQARQAATRNRLVSDGVDEATADAWIAAW